MSPEMKQYHEALLALYEDFENDNSRDSLKQAWTQLTEDEQDLLSLQCNAEVNEILY